MDLKKSASPFLINSHVDLESSWDNMSTRGGIVGAFQGAALPAGRKTYPLWLFYFAQLATSELRTVSFALFGSFFQNSYCIRIRTRGGLYGQLYPFAWRSSQGRSLGEFLKAKGYIWSYILSRVQIQTVNHFNSHKQKFLNGVSWIWYLENFFWGSNNKTTVFYYPQLLLFIPCGSAQLWQSPSLETLPREWQWPLLWPG